MKSIWEKVNNINPHEKEIFETLKEKYNSLYRDLLMLAWCFLGENVSENTALEILDDICSAVDETYNIGGYKHGTN